MAIAEDRFFETRATQLAIVHLTRRADVQVTREVRDDYNKVIDLLVSLLEDGHNVGCLLAVEVKAAMSEKEIQGSQKQWGQDNALNSYRLPLCLFVFSMDNDRGFWQWVRKPNMDGDEKRSLVSNDDRGFKPLTNEALDEILSSIRAWYGP